MGRGLDPLGAPGRPLPRPGTAQQLPRRLAWRGLARVLAGWPTSHPEEVSDETKAAAKDRLKARHADLDTGITPNAVYSAYTVRQAAEDWLKEGLDGRAAKTIKKTKTALDRDWDGPPARDLALAEVLGFLDQVEAFAASQAGGETAAAAVAVARQVRD